MNKQVGVKLVPCGGSEILRTVFQTRAAAEPTWSRFDFISSEATRPSRGQPHFWSG